MRRIALVALPTLLLLAEGQDWRKPVVGPGRIAHFAETCAHYENRARFLPREGVVPFVVLLADSCGRAQRSVRTGRYALRRAAERYLDRLATLRDTVVAMNVERVYGVNATRFSRPKEKQDLHRIAQVTETGEFLIARHMGLIDAYDDWRGRERAGPSLAQQR